MNDCFGSVMYCLERYVGDFGSFFLMIVKFCHFTVAKQILFEAGSIESDRPVKVTSGCLESYCDDYKFAHLTSFGAIIYKYDNFVLAWAVPGSVLSKSGGSMI